MSHAVAVIAGGLGASGAAAAAVLAAGYSEWDAKEWGMAAFLVATALLTAWTNYKAGKARQEAGEAKGAAGEAKQAATTAQETAAVAKETAAQNKGAIETLGGEVKHIDNKLNINSLLTSPPPAPVIPPWYPATPAASEPSLEPPTTAEK